ncbi:MAG: hypothetical protein ABSD85_09710 [Acidimicrobiales bacterium]
MAKALEEATNSSMLSTEMIPACLKAPSITRCEPPRDPLWGIETVAA